MTFIFYSFLSYHILAQSFSLFLSITTRLSFRHKMPGFLCLFSGLCTQPAELCPNLWRALPSRPARATPGPRTSGVSALLCQYLQNPNQLSTKTPYPLANAYQDVFTVFKENILIKADQLKNQISKSQFMLANLVFMAKTTQNFDFSG